MGNRLREGLILGEEEQVIGMLHYFLIATLLFFYPSLPRCRPYYRVEMIGRHLLYGIGTRVTVRCLCHDAAYGRISVAYPVGAVFLEIVQKE